MVVAGQFAVYNFCYIWDFFQHKKSFITQLLLPTQYFYDVTSERTWKKTRIKIVHDREPNLLKNYSQLRWNPFKNYITYQCSNVCQLLLFLRCVSADIQLLLSLASYHLTLGTFYYKAIPCTEPKLAVKKILLLGCCKMAAFCDSLLYSHKVWPNLGTGIHYTR